MGFITKLQAINQMLLAAGENLVADLVNDSGVDTGIADALLEQTSLDYQMRGMANNKYIREVIPDPISRKIYLPYGADDDEQGIISAELVSLHYNDKGQIIVARVNYEGTKPILWNITDDVGTWSTTPKYYVEMIMKLPWELLDTPIQRAIMTTAMRHYQAITQGDPGTDQFLAHQEALYSAKGRAADINDKKRNIFESGDSAVKAAVRRNPYINDPNRFRFWRTRGI